jgi:Crinkler effector protein N-terminal domain
MKAPGGCEIDACHTTNKAAIAAILKLIVDSASCTCHQCSSVFSLCSTFISFIFHRLHIQPIAAMPDTTLQLNCLVFGDDYHNGFIIKIADTETVSVLKEAIKEFKKTLFLNVDADELALWKASFPMDSRLGDNIRKVVLEDEQLSPLDELSEIFSKSLARKHVHVIVGRPPTGACE